MTTVYFKQAYIQSRAAVVGPLENDGPLQGLFDKTYEKVACEEKNFEKAERALIYDSCDFALRKANLTLKDIDLVIGGDLLNQLTSSHYFAKDLQKPFIGMYAACATSSLVISQAAMWVEQQLCKKILAFTSSHIATAERQFRFPNEYGIQKKETTTTTVTGAGAVIVGSEKTNIKISSFTLGRIIDWNFKNPNDMGIAMAPAAYDTLTRHLQNTNTNIKDYDLIVTGDLSKLGFSFLTELLQNDGYDIDNRLHDCGLIIYDILNQDVFCGGSGCACSMCVSVTKLMNDLEAGKYKKIMVIATGALLSLIAVQQKGTIPCIAHAIVYERGD